MSQLFIPSQKMTLRGRRDKVMRSIVLLEFTKELNGLGGRRGAGGLKEHRGR